MRRQKTKVFFALAGIAVGFGLLIAFDDKGAQLGGVIIVFLSIFLAILPIQNL